MSMLFLILYQKMRSIGIFIEIVLNFKMRGAIIIKV